MHWHYFYYFLKQNIWKAALGFLRRQIFQAFSNICNILLANSQDPFEQGQQQFGKRLANGA